MILEDIPEPPDEITNQDYNEDNAQNGKKGSINSFPSTLEDRLKSIEKKLIQHTKDNRIVRMALEYEINRLNMRISKIENENLINDESEKNKPIKTKISQVKKQTEKDGNTPEKITKKYFLRLESNTKKDKPDMKALIRKRFTTPKIHEKKIEKQTRPPDKHEIRKKSKSKFQIHRDKEKENIKISQKKIR